MKCSPNGCPIVAFSDLTPAEQRVERKRIAQKMSEQGFTQEQIAKQLGVTQRTISEDLRDFNLEETSKSKPAKTTTNPKGAGRPKGKRATTPVQDQQIAAAVLDEGKTREQARQEYNVSNTVVRRAVANEEGRREALADPEIDRSALSLTSQQKLDAAVRQHQRKLDAAFEGRVQEEINQRLDHIILPVWRKKIADAKKIYDVRRSITDKETFNVILKCLHTDTRKHIGDDIVNDAFSRFLALEKYLLNEKDSPTKFTGLPTTAAEWEQRKQEAATMRRAKRGHSNVQKSA
jgi:hypothetical protein